MGRVTTMATAAVLAAVFTTAAGAADEERVMEQSWGEADGKAVKLYTLTNANGLVARVTNFGAILTEMHVPDRNGELGDIVLGFDSLAPYVAGHPFFGATVGRYANRIANGRFRLGGREYTLPVNDEPNSLHGGTRGFDKHVWEAEPAMTGDGPGVKLTLVSPDGDEGYPGTLTSVVHYVLTNDNELRITMTATTDAPTVVNLANHTYWNLAGHDSGDVHDHEMQIFADAVTPTDETLIPTGRIRPVAGTAYDFRTPRKIGTDIDSIDIGGYDINFVLNGEMGTLHPAARVHDPATGRTMELATTEPGVQFYSGIHLDGVRGKDGAVYDKAQGFCLETQHFPDSPNRPEFPSTTLQPGQEYRHVMVHRFTAE